jgi:hypothetical protein
MTKSGKRYKFRNYEFWAADGVIAILDTSKAGSSRESVENATKYVFISDFIKNVIAAYGIHSAIDRREAKKMLEDAMECVKEANKKGDISNPKILQQKLEDSRPVKLSMANYGPSRIFPSASPRPLFESNLLGPSGKAFMRKIYELRASNSANVDDIFLNGIDYNTVITE